MIKLYKRLFTMLIVILLLISIFLIDTTIESNDINKNIKNFKSRGVLVYEIDNYSYYKISKKYDYENCSNICNDPLDTNIGTIGDIYISNRDPLGGFFITEWLSNIAWIGHCGMVYNEEGSQIIEIVGNKNKEDNIVKIVENNWMKIDSPEYLIMRVKDNNISKKEKLIDESVKILGCKYDYTFCLGGNKRFYCSNMISYLYKKININLNSDSLFTTGSDIITNENTYIIYYRERYIKNNKVCYNIYYLDEE